MADESPLASRGGPWKRLVATNVAAATAGFVSGGLVPKIKGSPFVASSTLFLISREEIPTSEKPTFAAGGITPNSIMFRPFGGNDNNDSFSMRVWGLTKGIGTVGTTATESWEATLLAQLLVTLGNLAGVAGTLIEAADLEADTISLVEGATQDVVINSPEGDLRQAWARIDHLAFPMLAVEFDESVNSGVAADDCNTLYRFLW